MKNIDVPVPRKVRKNPYKRVESVLRWTVAIIWPLFLLALVAGFVLLWVWAAQNGQFETIEVVETVTKPVNTWIQPVLWFGGLGLTVVVVAFIFAMGRIRDLWDEYSRNWERKKTEG